MGGLSGNVVVDIILLPVDHRKFADATSEAMDHRCRVAWASLAKASPGVWHVGSQAHDAIRKQVHGAFNHHISACLAHNRIPFQERGEFVRPTTPVFAVSRDPRAIMYVPQFAPREP